MDFSFSQVLRCSSSPSPCFSPDGKFFACVQDHYRLAIRDAHSHDLMQLYSCMDRIDGLEWSPSSQNILALIKARGIVQIWSSKESDWSCTINEGPAGIQSSLWSPDGLSVLLLASHGIRTTAWSLRDQKCIHLPPCKTPSLKQGLSFCPVHYGSFMAQLERSSDTRSDRVTIYDTLSRSRVAELSASSSAASKTFDAVQVSWSPNGCYIAVVDDSLQFKLLIYDAAAALMASSSSPPALPLIAYSPDGALGIKSISWDPSGQFLAIASFDNRLRVLNNVSWSQPTVDVDHPQTIQPGQPSNIAIYKEVEQDPCSTRMRYEIVEPPFSSLKPSSAPSHSKVGVNFMRWDPEGRMVATVSGSCPSAVWIWDVSLGGRLLAVCHHKEPVRAIEWKPIATSAGSDPQNHQCMLAIATEGSRVEGVSAKAYLWTPQGALIVNDVPMNRGFLMESLVWNHSGSFALIAKDNCCFVHLPRDMAGSS